MIKKCIALTILLMIFAVSVGFAEMKKSRLEMDFGTSYHLQIFNQILNPQAGKNLEPVEGLDGKTADGVIKDYRKRCTEKGKKNTDYTMTISSGKDK